MVTAPTGNNFGPVRVSNTFHFVYADGELYKPIGTTCYAWTHQTEALQERTLETLRSSPFNKIRMCFFPKHYAYNENEPELYPFTCLKKGRSEWTGSYKGHSDRHGGWKFDWSSFNPRAFSHFEKRVGDLMKLNIQADIILFHPDDRWGFAFMDKDTNQRYLRYMIARLSAYRNVWWSLANEWDYMPQIPKGDWETYSQLIRENDRYGWPAPFTTARSFSVRHTRRISAFSTTS
jgi:hypothetical protein